MWLPLAGLLLHPVFPVAPVPRDTIPSFACAQTQKCKSELVVPPLGPDSAVRLPVTVVRGGSDGPRVTVLAGIHGGEYASMVAAARLADQLRPDQLRGTVVIVHLANPVAFHGRAVYYTPADGRNLNRQFPGRADGTLSERTAHVLWTEVMRGSDVILDLHGGDANEELRPYVATRVTGDSAFDARVRRLALATGLPVLLETPVPDPVPSPPGTTTMAAAVSRIPGFTVEWGARGRVDAAAVTGHQRAVLGVLQALDMYPGRPGTPAAVRLPGSRTVTAPSSGFVRVLVQLDQVVQAGERVAELRDAWGVLSATLTAPVAGRVISYTATPPVRAGEPVVAIGLLPDQGTRVKRR